LHASHAHGAGQLHEGPQGHSWFVAEQPQALRVLQLQVFASSFFDMVSSC
jgi:hypothetical protein